MQIKLTKNIKIIIGFNYFMNWYYDCPHGRCHIPYKVFLLPVYIIKHY